VIMNFSLEVTCRQPLLQLDRWLNVLSGHWCLHCRCCWLQGEEKGGAPAYPEGEILRGSYPPLHVHFLLDRFPNLFVCKTIDKDVKCIFNLLHGKHSVLSLFHKRCSRPVWLW